MIIGLTECRSASIIIPNTPHKGKIPTGLKHVRSKFKVGCGKCSICKTERGLMRRAKWCRRLMGGIDYFQRKGFGIWNRGNIRYMQPGRVYFMSLTVRDNKYPGLSYLGDKPIDENLITRLNVTSKAFRNRSYRNLRSWFQQACKNLNLANRHSIRHVCFVEWGSKSTHRIHLHCFWFVSGDHVRGGEFCHSFLRHWRNLSNTLEGDFSFIESGPMAASYVTTYASKVMSDYRIMSSQFNWDDLDKLFRLEWLEMPIWAETVKTPAGHTKTVWTGGVERWRVYVEGVPLANVGGKSGLDASNVTSKEIVQALYEYRDNLLELGVLNVAEPKESPYKGGFTCWENPDSISTKDLQTFQESLLGVSQRRVLFLPITPSSKPRRTVLEDISRIWIQLPRKIREAVVDLFPRSLFGVALQFRVLGLIKNFYRGRRTVSTDPLQYT